MTTVTPRPISALLLACAITCTAGAQGDLTLAHFTAVPQSLLVNPATPQWARFSIGVGAGAAYRNSAFELGLLEVEGESLANALAEAIAEVRPADAVELDGRIGILDAALRTPVGYFSLGLAQRFSARVRTGGRPLSFAYLGAEAVAAREGEDLLADLHVDGGAMIELALGYQTAVPGRDDVTLGGRLKVLRGQVDAEEGSLAAIAREVDEGGVPVLVELTGEARTAGLAEAIDGEGDAMTILRRGSGLGAGLDLGVHLRLEGRWAASASLLDLGFVRWGGRVRRYRLAAAARGWRGVRAVDGPVLEYRDLADGLRVLDEEAGGTNAVVDGGSYTRALVTRLTLGGEYALADGARPSSVGGVYRVRLGGGGLRHGAALSFNWRRLRWVELSGSYGLDGGDVHLLGAAAAFTLGPVQVYAASDNALGAANYRRLGTTSILVGVNVVLGERRPDEVACPPMGGRRGPRWRG